MTPGIDGSSSKNDKPDIPHKAVELVDGSSDSYGTCFCIGISKPGPGLRIARFVTCAHVIEDVGEPGEPATIRVAGLEARVIHCGDETVDVAVLEVTFEGNRFQPLVFGSGPFRDGSHFVAHCYQRTGKATPIMRPLSGTVISNISVGTQMKFGGYDLKADSGKGSFRPGMSGSPVLDERGHVRGMLIQSNDQKDQASAIDVAEVLRTCWNLETQLPGRPEQMSVEAKEPTQKPEYKDERTREISLRLKAAISERLACLKEGRDTSSLDEEILALKRLLRDGPHLQAGDVLGNRYELIRKIGQGGFAVVWKACDLRKEQIVAVKVLHGQYGSDENRRKRFFRGAREMARLQHQFIVRVIEEEERDGNYHFFVMEYMAGGDFRQAVCDGQLTGDQRLSIIFKVADALAFAHQQGIVHRDVKPGNILLDDKGNPKISDFDLVWAGNTTGGTRTGALGTMIYAAPEMMINAKEPHVCADIYSLGMLALFAYTGRELDARVIYLRESFFQQCDLPQPVKSVLVKATDLEPENRYGSVAEFSMALEKALEGESPADTQNQEPRKVEDSKPEKSTRIKPPDEEVIADLLDQKRWCWIKPGTFTMGDNQGLEAEKPEHQVTIDPGFWLGKYPVTNREYRQFIHAGGYQREELWSKAGWAWKTEKNIKEQKSYNGFGDENQPVVGVSWYEGDAWCRWLYQVINEQQPSWLEPIIEAGLPTEAQWEFAARGTDGRKYPWGNEKPSAPLANYSQIIEKTTEPGRYPETLNGLLNMAGNVWEWCHDARDTLAYQKRAKGIKNPLTRPKADAARILRGGSWARSAEALRVTYRNWNKPKNRSRYRGFRPCLRGLVVAEHVLS